MAPDPEPDPAPQRKRRRETAAGCLTLAGMVPLVFGLLLFILPFVKVNRWVGPLHVAAGRGPGSYWHVMLEESRYDSRDTRIFVVRLGPLWWAVQAFK